ncbi:hypothetical protein ACHAXM_010308 [Skeletonema potamos]
MSTRTPKRYSKIPVKAGTNATSASIDESSEHKYNSEDENYDFEALTGSSDVDGCCIIDTTTTNNNTTTAASRTSIDGLSLDEKRTKYIAERTSSKEIKYLQDERFRDEYEDNDVMAQSPEKQYRYSLPPLIHRIVITNLVNDRTILRGYRKLCRVDQDYDNVDDGGITLIKLVKLWLVIIIGILIIHPFARWIKWEIDDSYTITDFVRYDFTTVLFDMLFFFVVGRMYDSRVDIDKLFLWGMFIALGCIYPSIANDFAFLRHSLSMYDMMCNWPMILFAYVVTLLVLAVLLVGGLLRSHYRRMVMISRCIESVMLACIFILPVASNSNFHLHHWFGMWFVGMQANAPEWWSRAFQAYCLGSYINGIAVYGRDPILGCNLAFYRSTNANCPYMSCYEEAGGNGTHHYKSFVYPDWRTCNATGIP